MRILHVITRLILGGAQENTLFTCQDLQHRHLDEVLLVAGPALGPEGDLAPQAAAARVPLQIIPTLRRELHPWRDYASWRALRQIIRDFHPDVVHTHSAKAGVLGRLAATQLQVPAVVHTVHGAPFYPGQKPWARAGVRWAECWAAQRCHALISVADAMTTQLVAAGVAPREKFTTIYSGMDVEPFLQADAQREAVRASLGFSAEDLVIGKVARLFPLKGHADVLTAAARLHERHPHLHWLFIGDGILRPALERRAQELGLADCVHFYGLAPPEQIPGLLAATDMVVHASLREGLARVLPQAMLAGRPVVCYDLDGAPEVVLPDVTGYLVPPSDPAALCQALESLILDSELRTRLGQQGRELCRDRFRHQTITEQIRALYTSLLS